MHVRDACLHELCAESRESEARIESLRSRLGVQDRTLHSAIHGASEERVQDGGAHALATPVAQHRHPADVAVRKEPARRDRKTGRVKHERVLAWGIPFVELDFRRHALLLDEHGKSHAARLLACLGPAQESDGIVG